MTTQTAAATHDGTGDEVRTYGLFIDGSERVTSDFVDRENPGTGRPVARFSLGTAEDAQSAIAAARREFDTGTWPRASGRERAAFLNRLADLMRRDGETLARIDAQEAGKPIRLARGDVDTSIALTEFAASLALTQHGAVYDNLGPGFTGLVTREPCGVVGMITPWNFPLLLLMQKLPYALAAGCTAVCKPSEFTSGSTLEIARLCQEAGLPDGVFNVVTGIGPVVGSVLAESDDIDMLSFTGSTRTGQIITAAAAPSAKRLSMELGGKSASIVFPDADIEAAIEGVLFAALFNTGECCVPGSRLLVHEDIADDFLTALVAKAERIRTARPLDESGDLGAMIHGDHLDSVLAKVEGARADGGRLLTGGRRLDGEAYDGGFFIEPTIIDNVSPQSRLFHDEVFGPVLAVTRFATTHEAISLANAVDYGLANAIWSSNIDTALETARRLRSGTVWINTSIDGAPQLPGGGVKRSGYGREMGVAGFEEFTEVKTIQIRTGGKDPFFRV